ncbi:MAG: hypothetical protein NTV49_05700 [Kiritimatiellaeota bacterium]|nr:hypothetical protein [Kiritimatiellota bacterium]
MNPRIHALLLLLALAGAAAAQTPVVKARLKLHGRPDQPVELLGRSAAGDIRVRLGAQGESGYSPADIESLEFEFDFDRAGLQQLYDQGQYGDVARLLKPALEPTFPFLVGRNNAYPYIRRWVKCLYWDGQYAETIAAAQRLHKDSSDPAIQREMLGLTAAALVGAGRTNEVPAFLRALEPIAKTNEESAAYWYATAQLHVAHKKIPEAQETIARLIGFRRHDPDWMPPALYLSAQLYARAKQPAVVRQIVKELNTLYPKSRWTTQATALEATLPPAAKPAPAPAAESTKENHKP